MYDLYLKLKEAGFPQGGSGKFLQHPDKDEKVYVPTAPEVFTAYIGDPEDWQKMVDAMAGVWMEKNKKV